MQATAAAAPLAGPVGGGGAGMEVDGDDVDEGEDGKAPLEPLPEGVSAIVML